MRHLYTRAKKKNKKLTQIVKDRKRGNIKQTTQHINMIIWKEAPVYSNQIFII